VNAAPAEQTHNAQADRVRGLRANSLAATVILLIEYGLGIWVNLYGRPPASGHGAGLAAGLGRALTAGPVALSIHAGLGLVLVVSAISALVRSVLVGRPVLIAVTSLGLLAVVAGAVSGARFVGDGDNASSMSMAVAAAVAIAAYALTLFLTASTPSQSRS
jgi:hypothetical protein